MKMHFKAIAENDFAEPDRIEAEFYEEVPDGTDVSYRSDFYDVHLIPDAIYALNRWIRNHFSEEFDGLSSVKDVYEISVKEVE